MTPRTRAAFLAGFCAFGLSLSAQAEPRDPFTGSFSASGTVTEGPDAVTHPVRCNFTSSPQGTTGLLLRGTCWAYLIISRSVSANLALDPGSGQVKGTYTGARVGAASLSGRRQGTAFDLVVHWPQPVFGNMTSDMRIVSLDSDHLRITVMSRIGANGPVRATTDLLLARN